MYACIYVHLRDKVRWKTVFCEGRLSVELTNVCHQKNAVEIFNNKAGLASTHAYLKRKKMSLCCIYMLVCYIIIFHRSGEGKYRQTSSSRIVFPAETRRQREGMIKNIFSVRVWFYRLLISRKEQCTSNVTLWYCYIALENRAWPFNRKVKNCAIYWIQFGLEEEENVTLICKLSSAENLKTFKFPYFLYTCESQVILSQMPAHLPNNSLSQSLKLTMEARSYFVLNKRRWL